MLNTEPTQRFSSRVENYARFRPSYPQEIIDLLKQECGLTQASVVADIASGTGIFTRFLLENGNRVIGVEPNADMRRAGEEYLANYRIHEHGQSADSRVVRNMAREYLAIRKQHGFPGGAVSL